MRLTTDLFADLQGEHREAGTRARSPATTTRRRAPSWSRRSRPRWLSGMAWMSRPRSTPGLKVDDFAPPLGVLLQRRQECLRGGSRREVSVCCGTCGRTRSRRRFGARYPRSPSRRVFHTETGGVDVDRSVAVQQRRPRRAAGFRRRLRAVLRASDTNGFDEALVRPVPAGGEVRAVNRGRRRRNESGATDTVDPFAGS